MTDTPIQGDYCLCASWAGSQVLPAPLLPLEACFPHTALARMTSREVSLNAQFYLKFSQLVFKGIVFEFRWNPQLWSLSVRIWFFISDFGHIQFSSVTQPCLTLCNPMKRSTPDLPVHHQLPEFTQTHVH